MIVDKLIELGWHFQPKCSLGLLLSGVKMQFWFVGCLSGYATWSHTVAKVK